MARVVQTIEVEIESRAVYDLLRIAYPNLLEQIDFTSIASMAVSADVVRITYIPRIHEDRDDVPTVDTGQPITLVRSANSRPDKPSVAIRNIEPEKKRCKCKYAFLLGLVFVSACLFALYYFT